MDAEDPTPVRSPSSMRLSQWGIVQAWLAEAPSRAVELVVLAGVLAVVARDGVHTARANVEQVEDPSRAALRAIGELGKRFAG